MTVTVRACAKINLGLEVLRRRPDGYHDIVTIFHGIDLCDSVTVEDAEGLTLESPDVGCEAGQNLALRAARLLLDRAGVTHGARIALLKRIPTAAGLGGGSSDAAATLKALNLLWALDLSPIDLATLGAALGADVPFFFHLPAALATCRGDQLEQLPPLAGAWAVVATPAARVPSKTRSLYQALIPADFSDGSSTLGLAGALRQSCAFDARLLRNAFERAARDLFPGLAACESAMIRAGAPLVRLSGSGPSLFTLLDDQVEATRLTGRLTAEGWPCLSVKLMTKESA